MVIPYTQIDTLFLDVGNTLISIDFDWVAAELSARRVACGAEDVRRAEAAARPDYSRRLFVDGASPGTDLFRFYLASILDGLDAASGLDGEQREQLLTALKTVLRPDGRASVLWRSVMPNVREALHGLRTLGLKMVVVSNSDGTVRLSLDAAGLLPFLDDVIDSALVGYEKPDVRIFDHALAVTGARPATTLHIGDLYHADVQGARQAGIHPLLLDPYGDWTDVDCEVAPDLTAVNQRFAAARQQLDPGVDTVRSGSST